MYDVCVVEGTLYGPLHTEVAVDGFEKAIGEVKAQVYNMHTSWPYIG